MRFVTHITRHFSFLFIMLLIALIGWHCQDTLLLNSDVSWFMHAAGRLISGGTYANDYFEVNPPMIIYLSIPPVLLAKALSIPHDLALRITVFALGFFSLIICKQILNLSVSETNRNYRYIFILALTAIYFIMPICDFGQREHLMVMLTMPWFLLAASRIETYRQPSRKLALTIGIMAGIGFAIKPYFYAAFFLVEYYLAKKEPVPITWKRTESITILGILVVYLGVIAIFHFDYLTDILPFITQYYYQSYSSAFSVLIFNQNTYFVLLSLFLGLICAKESDQQSLLVIIMLATIGFYFTYLMQRTQWYYHLYPMLALSTLLIGVSLAELMTRPLDFDTSVNLSILGGMVLAFIFLDFNYINQIAMYQTAAYFSIFIVTFSYLFYLSYQKRIRLEMVGLLVLMFYISFIFYENISMSIWEHWLFSLSTLMLFLLFALFIPARDTRHKMESVFYSIVGTIFLIYPFYQVSYIYNGNTAYKDMYQNLLADLRQYPHKTLTFITDSSEFAFPALDYTHQAFASRFGALGGLPRLSFDDDDRAYQLAYIQNKYKMDFIANAVATDIERYRPEMILVDRRAPDKSKKLGYFGNSQMNYIKLLTINSRFAQTWKSYHYVKTIDGQPLYRFEIYARDA